MPTYRTKIRKDTGETVEQLIAVPHADQLGEHLTQIDGLVVGCSEYDTSSDQLTVQTRASIELAQPKGKQPKLRSKPTEIVTFSWYLFTLVSAGVPLARGLSIVRTQLESPDWEKAIGRVIGSLERGDAFADAMRKIPGFFPSHFIHLVEVGEIAGNLDQVLQELATYYEKQLESKSRVKSALAYPAMLIGACTLVIFFLVAFVLPRIAKMFVNMQIELPWITSALMTLSDFLRSNLLLIFAGLVATATAFFVARKTPGGTRFLHKTYLRLPVFGLLYRKFLMARFCQTLSLLQKSGVSLLVSLNLARAGLENVILEDFFVEVERNLQEGASLGEEMARSPYVPEMVSSMISVGEETGQLTEMLINVSRFYERDIDQTVRTLPKLIEPTVIVAMTGIVGLLAASVFVPLSKLTKGIG
ncbi:MAG: type II secretion system F family protein [Planctomycetota bacterium]